MGVRGHLIQQKKTQCAASKIAVYKTATECSLSIFTQFDLIQTKKAH